MRSFLRHLVTEVNFFDFPVLPEGGDRTIPPAQRLLREGGICSCFYRMSDGTPVICAMPRDIQHGHESR